MANGSSRKEGSYSRVPLRTAVNNGGTENWTLPNRLKAASIAATLVVSLISIGVSLESHKKTAENAQAIETDRVELDHTLSNSNRDDYSDPWGPWEQPITPKTTYIGVQRRVLFKKPFSTVPSVSTALSLIDVKGTERVLTELGYSASEGNGGTYDFHIVCLADGITESAFILKIGVGMRRAPGEFLSGKLESTPIDDSFVADMMRYQQLSDRPSLRLTHDEQWMVNFYRIVGTLDASWIAKGQSK